MFCYLFLDIFHDLSFFFFFLIIRRPPRSTRMPHSFPTRRSSDLPLPETLEAFIEAIPLLPFDEAAAREYARLPFKRARFDRLLAAHASSLGVAIITNNESDFADVPGLAVENWTL